MKIDKTNYDHIHNNPPLQVVLAWSIITVLAVFGIFAPSLFGMDGMNGGFAISFSCFIMVLLGIIVIIIYIGRARKVQKILKGEKLLAHWNYTQAEWDKYAEVEYKEEKAGKKVLFFIVSGFAVFFGILFMIFDFESGKWVMAAMLILIGIMGFAAWFTSWYNHNQNKKYLGETFITEDALYINRQLHTWRSLGASLDSVKLSGSKSLLLLEFTYSAPTRTGLQEYTARIPVPGGQEEAARKILDHFNKTEPAF